MKKSISFFALAFLILTGQIQASSISQSQAQNIALNYFKIEVPTAATNPALNASLVYTQSESDGSIDFYVYNISPMKGFVFVSGDNNAIPVIAWSSESNFVIGDMSRIGLSDWIKSASTKIHYAVTNHVLADANIQYLWTSYAQGVNPQSTRSAGTIGPLLTTTWNQEPYYNSLCPPAALPSSSMSKAVTGCVATAMAQIMKYWNYPAQGTGGTISYNDNGPPYYSVDYGTLSANMNRPLYWANMPNNVTSDTDPVDSLMYELGVAVNMDYDSTGSGAIVLTSQAGGGPCSQTVYPTNFYYNPNTIQGVLLTSYTTSAWIALMENEINSGRVVQYQGTDPTAGGHTWVMDGYEPNAAGDMLHMNWGWGGVYDGYFAVTNLATPGFNPSENDGALIGIEPLWPFSVSLSTPQAICPNGSTTLSVQGPATATYTWSGASLSCTSCASPVASPTATSLYTVTVDSAGVTATLSVAVTVTQPVTAGFSFTAGASCSLPESVAFVNASTNATGYLWNFGDGDSSTSANPSHSYSTNGNYTAVLYATNACGTDSEVSSQPVQISGGSPVGTSATICSGEAANLTATGSSLLSWYANITDVTPIQTGNLYITPNLTSTTTYYVASVVSPNPVTVGPVSDAFGSSSNSAYNGTRGLTFDCSVAQTLNSVVVYSSIAGNRLFILQDSLGNILDSMTIYLSNGQQTVSLYFNIPVGTNMALVVTGTPNLTRTTSNVTFPYVSGDGTVSITGAYPAGAGPGGGARYNYFYDWQIELNPCTTSFIPVTAYVLNSPSGAGSFVAAGTGTPTVTFTPDDQSATTYSWSFGDGSTSTQSNPVHTYSSAGTYSVELILSNGTCSDTVTRTINTTILEGITELNAFASINAYPNPAKDQITLNINTSKAFSGCQLSINNVLGQDIYSENIDLNNGSNQLNLNLSDISAGVYFVNLRNGSNEVTTKFIKE